jgi:hypothetical protein
MVGDSKSGDQADQIAEQDEKKDGAEKVQVLLPVVADDVLRLIPQEAVDDLEYVLHAAGTVRGEPRAQICEHPNENEDHQELHRHKVGPGSGRVFGVQVN